MPLSAEARNRIFIATTDRTIGTEIADAIDDKASASTTQIFHAVVGAAEFSSHQPGRIPAPTTIGVTHGYIFTVNSHEAFRLYKITPDYSHGATLHVHWTKSTDAVENGNAVRWRVSYTLRPYNADYNISPTVIDLNDTYRHAGTTNRYVYAIDSPVLTGIEPNRYMSIKIEAVTPGGTPLSASPVLIGVDLVYHRFINR